MPMMLDTRWQSDANWAAHSDDVFTIFNAVKASGNTPTAVKSAALALSSRLALPMHVGPSRPLLDDGNGDRNGDCTGDNNDDNTGPSIGDGIDDNNNNSNDIAKMTITMTISMAIAMVIDFHVRQLSFQVCWVLNAACFQRALHLRRCSVACSQPIVFTGHTHTGVAPTAVATLFPNQCGERMQGPCHACPHFIAST